MFSSPFPQNCAFVLQTTQAPEHTVSSQRARDWQQGRTVALTALLQVEASFSKLPEIANPDFIKSGSRGEPLWPSGFLGSISHTEGWAAAVVGRTSQYRALGLDIEKVPDHDCKRLIDRICTPPEQNWCRETVATSAQRFTRVFSAKEAIFKAFYPVCHKPFYFAAVTLTPPTNATIDTMTFVGRLNQTLCPELPEGYEFSVESMLRNQHVLSAVALAKSS
jgi:enterobactin synthetase component D